MSSFHSRFALAAKRLGRGTQAKLAASIGVSQGSVSRYLNGEWPSAETLLRLPEALGVSGHWLLTGKGPMIAEETPEIEGARADGYRAAVSEMAARVGVVAAEMLKTVGNRMEANELVAQGDALLRPRPAGRGRADPGSRRASAGGEG